MTATHATPARFDAGNQRRRAMIAKAHIAKSQLRLTGDQYLQALMDATGEISAAMCDEAQLTKLMTHFERMGFKAMPAKAKPGRPAQADHPSARKARALWISLYYLGAIDNQSEKALEHFAARQLKVERLQWADQALCYKLIEALKAIGARHGWVQESGRPGDRASIRRLKMTLLDAIVAKLKARKLAGADWSIEGTAERLCGIEIGEYHLSLQSDQQLDDLARALGAKLRESGL